MPGGVIFEPVKDWVLRETCNHKNVKWKIKKFFDLPLTPCIKFDSLPFSFCDSDWFLQIYPNGDANSIASGWVSLYLHKKDCSSEVRISYTLGIEKPNDSMFKSSNGERSFGKEKAWGFREFVKRSDLLKSKNIVAPDGDLTVTCCIRLQNASADAGVQNSATNSIAVLQQNFHDLFLSKRHVDVTVQVQEQEFRAHWLILIARSSVFAAMFEHDTEEKQTGIVKITDCSSVCFNDFLSYLYTGKTDLISSSNAVNLYKIADKYNVKDLKINCEQVMAEELSVESFCDVISLATMYDEPRLLETATNFFIDKVETILPTSQWKSFLNEHSTVANELLIKMVNKHKCNK